VVNKTVDPEEGLSMAAALGQEKIGCAATDAAAASLSWSEEEVY
jgi:hypothetical protein